MGLVRVQVTRSADVLAGGGSTASLTAPELERLSRYRRRADQDDFLAGHLLARQVAGELLGRAPEDIVLRQECTRCGGPHGRPEVVGEPEVFLTLSHAAGVVAAAADDSPVGVDVEPIRRVAALDLADRVLSVDERRAVAEAPDPHVAFLRTWVRKECLVKVGLADLSTLSQADLSCADLPLADEIALTRLSERWRGLQLAEWTNRALGVVVAAMSSRAPVVAPPPTVP